MTGDCLLAKDMNSSELEILTISFTKGEELDLVKPVKEAYAAPQANNKDILARDKKIETHLVRHVPYPTRFIIFHFATRPEGSPAVAHAIKAPAPPLPSRGGVLV